MITVAIVNTSSVVADADLALIVAALQVQVTRDFAPIYGYDAHLLAVSKGGAVPAGAWTLDIADNADEPGALGYHQTTLGLPWGIVGAKDDLSAGGSLSVTISHELLEMLADAYVTSVALIDTPIGGFRGGMMAVIAYEVCDAVEADNLGYTVLVQDGAGNSHSVVVSDFVLPWWFGGDVPASSAGKYSFTGACTVPFGIDRAGVHGLLPGGYIGIMQVRASGGWSTVNARHQDRASELAERLDELLPGHTAHILLHGGVTQDRQAIPRASRRARILKQLAG
ncbi:MAG TPA: hypothetical protein VGG64_08855 [Pirellulales bacterium]